MRYCPNVACPGRVLEGIVHYAGRGAMDIRGLGYERVRQLLDAGLIHDVADLYKLKAGRLVELDRFAEQSAEQLVQAIANSKAQPLSLLLFGLGIRHVGKQVAQTLARHFGTLDALMAASREDIDEVPGVGSTIGDAVGRLLLRCAQSPAHGAAAQPRESTSPSRTWRLVTVRWPGSRSS